MRLRYELFAIITHPNPNPNTNPSLTRYELFAIITHQGRTAEGGHYVAWVKKNKATRPVTIGSGGCNPSSVGAATHIQSRPPVHWVE